MGKISDLTSTDSSGDVAPPPNIIRPKPPLGLLETDQGSDTPHPPQQGMRHRESILSHLFLEVVVADVVDLLSVLIAVVAADDSAAKCPVAVATPGPVAMVTPAAAAEFVAGVDGRPSVTD